MRPLTEFPPADRCKLRGLLFDIDDTLTTDGKLTAAAYTALEALHDAGFLTVPITGRPAGWCDHIARMWPVDAVVGENGALYFRRHGGRMIQRFQDEAETRAYNRRRLEELRDRILREVPGCAVASDQHYRVADLAIDFCEDVPALPGEQVGRIAELFAQAGATAKISSIHVNGWFGQYDKLGMTKRLFAEQFDTDLDTEQGAFAFIGDSPNDSPMFAFFDNSVGVANITEFAQFLDAAPRYVAAGRGGGGFVELAGALLAARR